MSLFPYRPTFDGKEIAFVGNEEFSKLQVIFDSCEDYERRLYAWGVGDISRLWTGTRKLFQLPPPLVIASVFEKETRFISIRPSNEVENSELERMLNKYYPGRGLDKMDKKPRKEKFSAITKKLAVKEAVKELTFGPGDFDKCKGQKDQGMASGQQWTRNE